MNLILDVETANVEVLKWLRDIANVRLHGTTNKVPLEQLKEEQPYLQALPLPYSGIHKPVVVKNTDQKPLFCSQPLQHSLSVYQQIGEAS